MKGDRLYWQVQESTSSPTGVGNRRKVLREFGMSSRIKPKRNTYHFNEGNRAQFGRSVEREKGSYVMFWN